MLRIFFHLHKYTQKLIFDSNGQTQYYSIIVIDLTNRQSDFAKYRMRMFMTWQGNTLTGNLGSHRLLYQVHAFVHNGVFAHNFAGE